MRESLRIIKQTIDLMPEGPVKPIGALGSTANPTATLAPIAQPEPADFNTSMEALIKHFKISTSGYALPNAETYCATESPKGEFGVLCVGSGSHRPYRVKIKSPDYASLQAIEIIGQGHYLADLVAIIGSLDVVFGSIDR